MPTKTGRPKGKSRARQHLIDAARRRFTLLPYEKVSTRMIAESAGVNPALIRYYFGSKAGLFEQMLRETMEPLRTFLDDPQQSGKRDGTDLIAFMRTYYRALAPTPDLPKLVLRVMSDPGAPQRPVTEKIIREFAGKIQLSVFHHPGLSPVLRAGVDPDWAKMTVLSLTLFPFLVPEPLLKLYGFELNESSLNQLLEHNIRLLELGLFSPPEDAS